MLTVHIFRIIILYHNLLEHIDIFNQTDLIGNCFERAILISTSITTTLFPLYRH